MPNWCECDLTVEGPREVVEAFLEAVKGENGLLDFERLIPYPLRFAELDRIAREWDKQPEEVRRKTERPKDGYNQGGYEWCVENWGTKWNAHEVTVEGPSCWGESATAELSFSTAWSPPLPV